MRERTVSIAIYEYLKNIDRYLNTIDGLADDIMYMDVDDIDRIVREIHENTDIVREMLEI